MVISRSHSSAGNAMDGHPNNPCDCGDNLTVDLGPNNGWEYLNGPPGFEWSYKKAELDGFSWTL